MGSLYGYSFNSVQDIADFIHVKNTDKFEKLIVESPNLGLVKISLYHKIFHSIASYNNATVTGIILSGKSFILKTLDYTCLINLLHHDSSGVCQIYSLGLKEYNGVLYNSITDYINKYSQLGVYPILSNGIIYTKKVTGHSKEICIFKTVYKSVSEASRVLDIRQQKLSDLVNKYAEGQELDNAVYNYLHGKERVSKILEKNSQKSEMIPGKQVEYKGKTYISINALARDQLDKEVFEKPKNRNRIRSHIGRIINSKSLTNEEKEVKLEEFFSNPSQKRFVSKGKLVIYKGVSFESDLQLCRKILGKLYSDCTVDNIRYHIRKVYTGQEVDDKISQYLQSFIKRKLNIQLRKTEYHVEFEYESYCTFYFSLVSSDGSYDEVLSSEEIANFIERSKKVSNC